MRKNRYRSVFKNEEIRMSRKGCVNTQEALDIIYNYLGIEKSKTIYLKWRTDFLKEVDPYEIIGPRKYYYCSDITKWLKDKTDDKNITL